MRIQVFLSHNGVCSRRDAMNYIKEGRVTLNGTIVREPSTPVDPRKDQIKVDGKVIESMALQYILLNKPAGFITTKEDAHAQRTVMDLLPKELQHLVPVGRLDQDTEGLLLLTNDGDLTFRLTHPQFYVDKTYLVRIGGRLLSEKKQRLERGITLEGRMTKPALINDVKVIDDQTEFLMTIQEGRKRQIRLMLKSVGCFVHYLKRVAQGSLQLGNLALGKWRNLTPVELKQLKSLSSKRVETHPAIQPPAVELRSRPKRFSNQKKTLKSSNRPFNRQHKTHRRTNNDHS